MPTLEERKLALAEWCDHMAQYGQGRIVLSNLLYDVRNGRAPQALFSEFLRRLADDWWATRPHPKGAIRKVEPAIELFDKVRRTMDETEEINCQGIPPVARCVDCSTVMSTLDFKQILLERVTSHTYRGEIFEEELARLERMKSLAKAVKPSAKMPPHPEEEDAAEAKPGERRRKGKHYMWVTHTQHITDLRDDPQIESLEHLAAVLRSKLGLFHHIEEDGKGQHYIEVLYPTGAFRENADPDSQERLVPPTVLDGGTSPVYRSQSGPDGWGMTLELNETMSGLPEAVHLRIPVRGAFKVRRLGYPDRTVVNVQIANVAKSAPEAWEPCDVSDLEALL